MAYPIQSCEWKRIIARIATLLVPMSAVMNWFIFIPAGEELFDQLPESEVLTTLRIPMFILALCIFAFFYSRMVVFILFYHPYQLFMTITLHSFGFYTLHGWRGLDILPLRALLIYLPLIMAFNRLYCFVTDCTPNEEELQRDFQTMWDPLSSDYPPGSEQNKERLLIEMA